MTSKLSRLSFCEMANNKNSTQIDSKIFSIQVIEKDKPKLYLYVYATQSF